MASFAQQHGTSFKASENINDLSETLFFVQFYCDKTVKIDTLTKVLPECMVLFLFVQMSSIFKCHKKVQYRLFGIGN